MSLKELRNLTGAGVNVCVQALKDADGNLDKAVALIKERGQSSARNYESRETKAGMIGVYQHHNKQIGAMVFLGCETDFVARMPNFITFANALAQHVAAMNPPSKEELLKQPYILFPDDTVEQTLLVFSGLCKEKVSIQNFQRLEV